MAIQHTQTIMEIKIHPKTLVNPPPGNLLLVKGQDEEGKVSYAICANTSPNLTFCGTLPDPIISDEDAIYKGLAAIYELLADKNCHPYHPYQVEPVEGEK